jgi:hypothetical protein
VRYLPMRPSVGFWLSLAFSLTALACGREPLDLGPTGSGGGGGSAGAIGTGDSGQGRIPLYHRATAVACPSQRGPGASSVIENGMPGFPACPTARPSIPVCCSSDSECDGGTNGRCMTSGGRGGNACSYDECLNDSHCPSGGPCLCRSSPADNVPNACAPPGNCKVDSDCGSGGYCSPSPSPSAQECGGVSPYSGPFYCHTASDACIDHGDCGSGAFCVYAPQTRHWACSPAPGCPP